jgi:SHS family lactate transporter-like MFS transporter
MALTSNPESAGPTMGIATAIIALGIIGTTIFGPERRGAKFELAKPAGVDVEDAMRNKSVDVESQVGGGGEDKGRVELNEKI